MTVVASIPRRRFTTPARSTVRVTVDRTEERADVIRVVVVDPDPFSSRLVSEQLRAASGFAVVGTPGTAREGIDLARHYAPDIVLLEPRLPDADGIDATTRLAKAAPASSIVLLAAAGDERLALEAFRAGAVGFVPKELEPARLPRVLARVARGEAIIPRRLAASVLAELRRVPVRGYRPLRSRLSTREWEIVDLLSEGARTPDIAERLFLSQATVYSHVKHIMRKLGVRNRADAVAAAERLRPEELGLDQ